MKFRAEITMTLIYEADIDEYEWQEHNGKRVVTPEDAIAFDLRGLRNNDFEVWDLELTEDPIQYDIRRLVV